MLQIAMKQLWDGAALKLVYEIRMDLTNLTSSCIFYRIYNHYWTIIAKFVQSVLKLRT